MSKTQRWTLSLFNCCVGGRLEALVQFQQGTKPTLLSPVPRPACQYTCFLSVLGRKRGGEGWGWGDNDKQTSYIFPSFSLFVCCFVATPSSVKGSSIKLTLLWLGACFRVIKKRIPGKVYLHLSWFITQSPLSLHFFILFFLNLEPLYGFLFMWHWAHTSLIQPVPW